VNAPLEIIGRERLKPLCSVSRTVEKGSGSKHLDAHARGFAGQEQKSSPPLQVELVCQDDTDGFDPFWDGPRLVPVFVAQLLGQAMPDLAARAHVVVERAYGAYTAVPGIALLVDRKS
jgi:hypothetical protein